MARKRSVALTDGELRLMRVLWDKGRATVGEVVDGLNGPRKPAYNTVLLPPWDGEEGAGGTAAPLPSGRASGPAEA